MIQSAGASTVLEVRDLKLYFPVRRGVLQRVRAWVRAVDGVSFSMSYGETLGLVGESGSGKSTLGRAILRLYEPSEGAVSVLGHDVVRSGKKGLRQLRRNAQMIFQDPFASVNPRMQIDDIVAEPMEIHGIGTPSERRRRVAEALDLVGISPTAHDRYPHEFSGGQLQRIGIARAIALKPAFVILDEPVSALDVSIQAQILNLLMDLQGELGLTYLFVAHDLGVVRQVADRIAVMYLGQIVEVGSRERIYTSPGHPYTAALLSAVPIPDPALERRRKRIILVGDVPSPVKPPNGCRFHTRCWLRERLGRPEVCERTVPVLRVLSDGSEVRCHFPDETSGAMAS
jgi:peptide/nickel transport system ATP-binding protein/oligopeptide transport system ATP-binding protein